MPIPASTRGVMKITRGESAPDPYSVEELPGLQLSGDDVVDLCDPDNGAGLFYDNWQAAANLVDSCVNAQLCQDIEAGVIEVTERKSPQVKVGSLV